MPTWAYEMPPLQLVLIVVLGIETASLIGLLLARRWLLPRLKIEDPKIHYILVALMAGFLAMVIFMIAINDKPFFGYVSIPPDSYQLVLDKLIELRK